jgi:hypothetical protein
MNDVILNNAPKPGPAEMADISLEEEEALLQENGKGLEEELTNSIRDLSMSQDSPFTSADSGQTADA